MAKVLRVCRNGGAITKFQKKGGVARKGTAQKPATFCKNGEKKREWKGGKQS